MWGNAHSVIYLFYLNQIQTQIQIDNTQAERLYLLSYIESGFLGIYGNEKQHNDKEQHYNEEWQNKRLENAWRCYNALV